MLVIRKFASTFFQRLELPNWYSSRSRPNQGTLFQQITRNGKPVAIMASKDEYDGWQETVEIMRDANFMKEIRKGILSLKRTKKRYTLDELFSD